MPFCLLENIPLRKMPQNVSKKNAHPGEHALLEKCPFLGKSTSLKMLKVYIVHFISPAKEHVLHESQSVVLGGGHGCTLLQFSE